MITTMKLVNASLTLHNYCFCVCVVGTFKIYHLVIFKYIIMSLAIHPAIH